MSTQLFSSTPNLSLFLLRDDCNYKIRRKIRTRSSPDTTSESNLYCFRLRRAYRKTSSKIALIIRPPNGRKLLQESVSRTSVRTTLRKHSACNLADTFLGR